MSERPTPTKRPSLEFGRRLEEKWLVEFEQAGPSLSEIPKRLIPMALAM